jgi:hypothetical protein
VPSMSDVGERGFHCHKNYTAADELNCACLCTSHSFVSMALSEFGNKQELPKTV